MIRLRPVTTQIASGKIYRPSKLHKSKQVTMKQFNDEFKMSADGDVYFGPDADIEQMEQDAKRRTIYHSRHLAEPDCIIEGYE